jgi:hypothetical protein
MTVIMVMVIMMEVNGYCVHVCKPRRKKKKEFRGQGCGVDR